MGYNGEQHSSLSRKMNFWKYKPYIKINVLLKWNFSLLINLFVYYLLLLQTSVTTFKTALTNGSAGHGIGDTNMPGGTATPGTPKSKVKYYNKLFVAM